MPEHDENLEKFGAIPEGDTRTDAPGEGDHPPTPPGGGSPPGHTLEGAALRLVSAEALARGLSLGSFRDAMRARATDPVALARLDAMLQGTPDPVTGRPIPMKPAEWAAVWQDVANRGYGRPHQSLDVTSGGEALSPGVVFLPLPVPLAGPDSPEAVELDEGSDLNPIRMLGAGNEVKVDAARVVARVIEAGRDSGELPR